MAARKSTTTIAIPQAGHCPVAVALRASDGHPHAGSPAASRPCSHVCPRCLPARYSLYCQGLGPRLGGSHSGLVRPPAKRVGAVEASRGFESLPLRHVGPELGFGLFDSPPRLFGCLAEGFTPAGLICLERHAARQPHELGVRGIGPQLLRDRGPALHDRDESVPNWGHRAIPRTCRSAPSRPLRSTLGCPPLGRVLVETHNRLVHLDRQGILAGVLGGRGRLPPFADTLLTESSSSDSS